MNMGEQGAFKFKSMYIKVNKIRELHFGNYNLLTVVATV